MDIIEIIAIAISVVSLIFAIFATIYARHSVTTSILVELKETYSTKEMNEAVHYLKKLREKHIDEIKENPYSFARKYLGTVSPDSHEWEMRRMVSHFYNHLGGLLENGLISEKIIFSLWAENDLSLISFLEPIETIIVEKFYSLPLDAEWLALRLLYRCQKWQRKQRKKLNKRFTIPQNPILYEKSLNQTKSSS